jgi:hypothetical protein
MNKWTRDIPYWLGKMGNNFVWCKIQKLSFAVYYYISAVCSKCAVPKTNTSYISFTDCETGIWSTCFTKFLLILFPLLQCLLKIYSSVLYTQSFFYTISIAPMFTKNLFQCILYILHFCYKIFKKFKMFLASYLIQFCLIIWQHQETNMSPFCCRPWGQV